MIDDEGGRNETHVDSRMFEAKKMDWQKFQFLISKFKMFLVIHKKKERECHRVR